MILRLFQRDPRFATISRLYGAIVAQARQPEFYRSYGVPDSLDGRFEMILLHTVLVVRRMRREGRAGQELGQAIFDRFCSDMDGSLREMGVGDLKVPKQMQKVGAAFYERQEGYDTALTMSGGAVDDDAVAAQVQRNFSGLPPVGAKSLAAYIRQAAQRLEDQPASVLSSGQIAFPDVGSGPLATEAER